jgi:excisionase family DNA binding protein
VLTVPEVARRLDRNPETIRRWIREGKLRSQKVGTQHLIDEEVLQGLLDEEMLPLPPDWPAESWTGEPLPNWVAILDRQRREH